jgi:hypothetical protein
MAAIEVTLRTCFGLLGHQHVLVACEACQTALVLKTEYSSVVHLCCSLIKTLRMDLGAHTCEWYDFRGRRFVGMMQLGGGARAPRCSGKEILL